MSLISVGRSGVGHGAYGWEKPTLDAGGTGPLAFPQPSSTSTHITPARIPARNGSNRPR